MDTNNKEPPVFSDHRAEILMELLVTMALANEGFKPVNLKITKVSNEKAGAS